MNLNRIKQFLSNEYYQPTRLSDNYKGKTYPYQVEIKNSVKWNLLMFIAMAILAIFLLKDMSTSSSRYLTITFCIFILVAPLFYLFDKRPLMTISNKGILFKNKKFKKWSEITGTFIDDSDSTLLIIHFIDAKKKTLSLQDLTFSWDEICHIIEYFKLRSDE